MLKANNVMYHKANLKLLSVLIEANNKVFSLTISAKRIDKKLSSWKPYDDKNGLAFIKSSSSSIVTKAKIMKESKLVASITNPHSENRFLPTCHHCDEVDHIIPKYHMLQTGKNVTLKGQVDLLVVEANRISQLVQSFSLNHVKPSAKQIKKVSDKCLVILNARSFTKLNV